MHSGVRRGGIVFNWMGGAGSERFIGGVGWVGGKQFAAQRFVWRWDLPVGRWRKELGKSGTEEVGACGPGGGRSTRFEGRIRGGGGAALGSGWRSRALQIGGWREDLEGGADDQREHGRGGCGDRSVESGHCVCGGVPAAAACVHFDRWRTGERDL